MNNMKKNLTRFLTTILISDNAIYLDEKFNYFCITITYV
jgi:hypothetical protein